MPLNDVNLDPEKLRRFNVLNAGLAAAEVKPIVNIWGRGVSSRQRRVLLEGSCGMFLEIGEQFLGLLPYVISLNESSSHRAETKES